jgi:hypothetical protein
MIARASVLLGLAIALVAGCGGGLAQVQDDVVADDVVGRWRNPKNGYRIEIERREDRYVIVGTADARGRLFVPEVIGEFRPEPGSRRAFVGRHVWGGRWGSRGPVDPRWGEQGGLLVRQLGKDSISVRYTDSRYDLGWEYQREPAGQP